MHNPKPIEKHPPIRLNFDLSDGCNLRCVMCGGGKGYKNRTIVDFEEFKSKILPFFRFVDDFQFGCRKEPLMTPYYSEAVRLIKPFLRPDVKGWAITNGMLLSEPSIEAIIDSDIYDTFRISFDGASKAVFEDIRRGAKYETVIRNIKNLVDYRNHRKSNTKIGVLFTIMKSNIHELPDMIKLADSLGIDLVTTHQLSPDDSNFVEKEYLKILLENMNKAEELSEQYNIEFYGTMYRTREEYEKIISDADKQIERGIAYCGMLVPLKSISKKELRNSDGKLTFVLDPHGNLNTPCMQMREEVVGNLLHSSYEDIINDPRFSLLLNSIKKVDPSICAKCYMLRYDEALEINTSAHNSSSQNPDLSALGSQTNSSDKRNLKLQAPSKILLPRFDTHGDLVLFEGFIEALLDRFPHAEITLLVREGYEQLAPVFPPRLRWMTTSFNPYGNNPYKDMELVTSLLDKIGDEQWDMIIFGAYSRVFIEEIIAAKFPKAFRIAFEGKNQTFTWPHHVLHTLGLSETDNVDVTVSVDERLHETEKYSLLWSNIFREDKALPLPRLVVPENLRSASRQLIASLGLEGRDYVVCLPAGADNVRIKLWPVERYAEILTWLHEEYGFQPLVVGHQQEKEIIEKLCALLQERGVNAVKWCGKTGELSVLAAIMSKASMYIGNDSGPMHIANALGIPTVGIFGGGHWPRFKLKGSKSISVFCYLPCYYCMWDCVFGDAPCVKLIGVEDVKEAVRTVLSEDDSKPTEFNAAYTADEFTQGIIIKAKENYVALRRELHQRAIDPLTGQLEKCDNNEIENLKKTIDEMRNSLSWRMAEPVRNCISFIKKVLS